MAADAAGAAAPEGEMAQNGQDVFFRQWLEVYGQEEYALYRKDAGAECLSYEDWTLSQHALGPYLYRLTIDAWDLVSSDVSFYDFL